jgi:hypothetical protein
MEEAERESDNHCPHYLYINDQSFSFHVVLKTEISLYVDGNATDTNQYMDHIQNIPPFKGSSFL